MKIKTTLKGQEQTTRMGPRDFVEVEAPNGIVRVCTHQGTEEVVVLVQHLEGRSIRILSMKDIQKEERPNEEVEA